MILFGSVAYEDNGDESDINILIDVHQDNKELESIIDNLVVDFILEKEVTEDYLKTKDLISLKSLWAKVLLYKC